MSATVHLLGVRHHGPGSARSLVRALDEIDPDALLVEGPPDAQELLTFAASEQMRPPVALLVHRPDRPGKGSFFPFAEFSPEWQALRHAHAHEVPLRFMDLPQRHRFALEDEEEAERASSAASDSPAQPEREPALDPFELLGRAAGHGDGERWWDENVERRRTGGRESFELVQELMTALRSELPQARDPFEARREAWMRQTLREELKAGRQRVAVVCGAWHVPALAQLPPAKDDAALLRGMPRTAVSATWVPWTHGRLASASGYGAGVDSPGFYAHLWSTPLASDVAPRWLTRVARLLRDEDLEGSTASIIEATRLARALAQLRGQMLPGLAELTEATRAVFCFGDALPLRLVHEKLVVGESLGAVPDTAPRVPLQLDLEARQKSLRLAREALDKPIELDLRKPLDLERSRLLHRLNVLGIPWGRVETARGARGTFREPWTLRWEPEFELRVLERAPYGNTLDDAAARWAIERADEEHELAPLTGLLDALLLADLPLAIGHATQRLRAVAALTTDVGRMLAAVPALAGAQRYGGVRPADVGALGEILDGLVARIAAGLPAACVGLADDAAAELTGHFGAMDAALALLERAELCEPWRDALERVVALANVHGLIAGRCERLLFDARRVDAQALSARLSRALSRAQPPDWTAAWLEGFLGTSGVLLVHQDAVREALDTWLTALAPEHFVAVLPLLRRTFGAFAPAERRQLAQLVRSETQRPGALPSARADEDVDVERARLVLPTLRLLLGASAARTS